ncbi:hypothetical protein GXP70_04295 [Paenibacillus lycopersici]|uniref:Uncharacterized protein n=1 Tax=Paenibacillus lycopersici TaxID=2704462 RepID=A0A6C0FQ55_9BACL|nr:hypothetical protein [Paenibacillus lycopersici]QHT59266.1 hypothetical protein GXP70_04295 [Paenibacillus lycopersici]
MHLNSAHETQGKRDMLIWLQSIVEGEVVAIVDCARELQLSDALSHLFTEIHKKALTLTSFEDLKASHYDSVASIWPIHFINDGYRASLDQIRDESSLAVIIPYPTEKHSIENLAKIFEQIERSCSIRRIEMSILGIGLAATKQRDGIRPLLGKEASPQLKAIIDQHYAAFKEAAEWSSANIQLQLANLKLANVILASQNARLAEELEHSRGKNAELKNVIDSKNNELLNRLHSEEELLINCKELMHEQVRLEAKYSNITKKYELLSRAKLGKLTIRYWKYKKRIPEDF